MAIRIKAALLLCLMSAAAYSVYGAYSSIHRLSSRDMPQEVYALFSLWEDEAAYYLRDSEGHVAVYESRRGRTPIAVTGIETRLLRDADRQLIAKGIPVPGPGELLTLLEDLGS